MSTALDSFNFFYPLRVRYAEIDGQKIVFNGVYLTYLDVAITEYFRYLGLDYIQLEDSHQMDMALVKTTLEFKQPAYVDQVLRVYVRVARLGRTSYTVEFAITDETGDTIMLTAESVYVNANPAQGGARPLPSFFRDAVTQFEDGLDA